MWNKIVRFFFASVYEVITWVWIGLSIGAYFYNAGNKNTQGVRLAILSLVLSVGAMLIFIGKRIFWDSIEAPKRPELSIEKVFVKTLEAGKPETIVMEIVNRGDATAYNITFYSTLAHQPKDSDSLLMYGKKPPDVTASLASGAPLTVNFRSNWINTSADIEAINSGYILIFHFGKGHYKDEAGLVHPFHYCFIYEPPERNMQICPNRYKPRDGRTPIIKDRPELSLERAFITFKPKTPTERLPEISVVVRNTGKSDCPRYRISGARLLETYFV